MNHRKVGRKFGKNSSHRKAMFKNMCCSLIEHEVIRTTLPKAKELRRYIEPLITMAKKSDTVHSRRLAFNQLRSKNAVSKLFERIGKNQGIRERNGGYIRVLKHGIRQGDATPMAAVMFVDDLDSKS